MKYTPTKYEGISSYQVKSGIRYRVRMTYTEDGIRQEYSKSGFKKLSDARNRYNEISNKISSGVSKLISGETRTLNDQYDSYSQNKIENRKWNRGTQLTNDYRYKVWREKFGDTAMSKITVSDLKKAIADMYATFDYAEDTMHGFVSLFNQIIDDAVDDGYIERNIYGKVSFKKPSGRTPKNKVVDWNDYVAFMAYAEQRLRADVYRSLYFTTFGLRRGEVYGIKQRNIKFLPNGLARIDIVCSRTTAYPEGGTVKTRGSNRIIVLDETGTEYLIEQIELAKTISKMHGRILHEDDFIFINPETGTPPDVRLLTQEMNKLCEALREEELLDIHITPHMIRHMFATYANASGVDSIQLRNFLGHVDVETTQHYTKASEEAAENVMQMTKRIRAWKVE